MKLIVLSFVFITAAAEAAPKRHPTTCEDIAAGLQKSVDNKMAGKFSPSRIRITPKSWGPIPAPLQALPKGATFCGSNEAFFGDAKSGVVTVDYLSPIWGTEIADFYRPIAQKMGCELQPMDTSDGAYTMHSRTSIKCPKHISYTISAPEDMFISIGVSSN